MFGMQQSKIQSKTFQLDNTIGKTDHLLCGSFSQPCGVEL